MNSIEINDLVVTLIDVDVRTVATERIHPVPAGSVGTIIAIDSADNASVTCKVEFNLGGLGSARATIQKQDIERLSKGKVFHGVVWQSQPEDIGIRVAAVASNLDDAHQMLESRYGVGTVFGLHNKTDAELPRQANCGTV